jgi:YegS/Rv2252/BmrU family lipid kinase
LNKYSFVVNPNAGKGKGEKVLRQLKAQLAERKLDAKIFLTEKSGHATELARNAPSEIVVAVGGDGTVNEVANALVGSAKTLGIIPAGSGNDLIKSLDIPADFAGAFAQIITGKTKHIDCATVNCKQWQKDSNAGNSHERYFVNGVGIGFDAAVAERTNKIKFLRGTAVYVLAVFQTLGKYKSPNFTVSLDSNLYESHNLLIAIGNGRCAGGGFYLTPQAKIDDGLLDVCLIDEMSIPRILSLMPKVMKGKHYNVDGVTMKLAKEISVRAEQPFYVHADGEIVGRNVNEVSIRAIEKGLNVIVG